MNAQPRAIEQAIGSLVVRAEIWTLRPLRPLQPKLQEKPPDRLTEAEVAALERLPEPPYGFVLRFALATGSVGVSWCARGGTTWRMGCWW